MPTPGEEGIRAGREDARPYHYLIIYGVGTEENGREVLKTADDVRAFLKDTSDMAEATIEKIIRTGKHDEGAGRDHNWVRLIKPDEREERRRRRKLAL